MNYWTPTLWCKSPDHICPLHGPAFLPYPTLLGITSSQPDWPRDGWQAFVVCDKCGHGYMYGKQDVKWGQAPDLGLWTQNAFLRIELKCAQESCALPVIAHLFAPQSWSTRDIEAKIMHGENEFACKAGYPILLPVRVTKFEAIDDL